MPSIHSYVAILAAAALAVGCHRENVHAQTPVNGATREMPPAAAPGASATENTPATVNAQGADGTSTESPGAGSATTGSGPGTTGRASGHVGPTTIAPGTVAPGSANAPPSSPGAGSGAPEKSESTKGSGLR